MSLQLTRDVPARKLKFAIWRTEHTQPEDPHFESNQEADGRSHHLQAWLLPAGNDFRLELHIESAQGNDEPSKVSAALAATQKRIERLEAKWKKLPNKSGFIDFGQGGSK